MITVAHPDPDEAHVFVWNSNAEEQLSALIDHWLNENDTRRDYL